jgi:alcohol sulfotransferase
VRKAKVGGYRDYFDDRQITAMQQLVSERLDPVFGYTPRPPATEEAASA